uniref:Uncharacterized protein n=1 Tax=Anguilla anguilla TaxID=7936 RepID=A0A0E9PJJ9_ANGAN
MCSNFVREHFRLLRCVGYSFFLTTLKIHNSLLKQS